MQAKQHITAALYEKIKKLSTVADHDTEEGCDAGYHETAPAEAAHLTRLQRTTGGGPPLQAASTPDLQDEFAADETDEPVCLESHAE